MKKFWMIADTTRWDDADNGIDMVLETSLNPICYFGKVDAEENLLKLRKLNPRRAYVLLEVVAFAEHGITGQEIHIEPITE